MVCEFIATSQLTNGILLLSMEPVSSIVKALTPWEDSTMELRNRQSNYAESALRMERNPEHGQLFG